MLALTCLASLCWGRRVGQGGTARAEGKSGESWGTPSHLKVCLHLAEEKYRTRFREIVRENDETAAARRAESLIPTLGPEGVRAQNPETRPKRIKKSPAPFFHALRKKVRKALWEAYGVFLTAYREAAEKWRAGDRGAAFPAGSFPPGLPFVAG